MGPSRLLPRFGATSGPGEWSDLHTCGMTEQQAELIAEDPQGCYTVRRVFGAPVSRSAPCWTAWRPGFPRTRYWPSTRPSLSRPSGLRPPMKRRWRGKSSSRCEGEAEARRKPASPRPHGALAATTTWSRQRSCRCSRSNARASLLPWTGCLSPSTAVSAMSAADPPNIVEWSCSVRPARIRGNSIAAGPPGLQA